MNDYIKKAHIKYCYTDQEIKELHKCSEDPIYFCENYVYVQTTKEGRKLFKLYDFQKRFINQLMNYKYNIALMSRQMGKCVTGDTRIKVRNSKTGQIFETTIENFHEIIKKEKDKC